MSVEQLQILSFISYIVAVVLAFLAVALFFLLDIKKVIGDVTGATARKAINTIRKQSESSANKAYKPGSANSTREKLTDKMSPSGRLKTQTANISGAPGTEKFNTKKLMPLVEETTVFDGTANETKILDEQVGQTTVLEQNFGNGETTVLFGDLSVQSPKVETEKPDKKLDFITDVEMGFTDSSEIIE